MQKTGILVQARMSSRRCPGKVMADLNGVPLLERLLESLEKNKLGLPVILCTSTESSDDPVAEHLEKRGSPFFRGELENVSQRFIGAAQKFELDHLVRISGDSPWFQVGVVDQALETYFAKSPDICCNIYPRSYPKGQSIEVFSTELLKRFYPDMSPEDREHVTPIFYRHGESLTIENVSYARPSNHLDLSVDTPEQLKACQEHFSKLSKPHWQYSIEEILALYSLA